jgi:septum site-determining protein MinC
MDIILMSENRVKTQAFKLKGRLYTFTVLQLLSAEKDCIEQQCSETVAKAPKLFERTPVVLDLSELQNQELDLSGICQILRQQGMIPVAIQGGSALQDTLAQCTGLAVLNASGSQDRPVIEQTLESEPTKAPRSRLVSQPVRSGQQVVAKGGDLIVSAPVSPGAELLADGHIHVYGALRGRALAGISGDTEARIYCQSLDAELVSIAGYYRLSDAIEPINGPCQIFLVDQHIVIEPL